MGAFTYHVAAPVTRNRAFGTRCRDLAGLLGIAASVLLLISRGSPS